ncbi:hypothetical protein CsSME_00025791 [Camellia sinensis var. sinensis]
MECRDALVLVDQKIIEEQARGINTTQEPTAILKAPDSRSRLIDESCLKVEQENMKKPCDARAQM